MEENKSCLRIRIKFPKKSPTLIASDEGCRTAHNEGIPSSNSENANVKYPKSTTPTCPECAKTFPSNKSLFGHLRCHPNRNYRGAYPPPMATKKRRYPEAHDSAAKPLPSAPKWPTAKLGRELLRDIEDEAEKAVAALTLVQISKAQLVVIVNELKTPEGNRIVKKKKMEESEMKNAEPGACGRRYKCNMCMKSFSSYHALGGHKASHRKNKNTNPKAKENVNADHTSQAASICNSQEAFRREHLKEATRDPSPSYHSSDQTDSKKANHRVFDFDLNEIPKPEGEEES